MKVSIVGKLVEHANGIIDLDGWVFDCGCCASLEEAVKTHRQEFIKLAKEAGTYSMKREMTLEEAIDIQERRAASQFIKGFEPVFEATRLGIEALKAVIDARANNYYTPIPPLPGETEK